MTFEVLRRVMFVMLVLSLPAGAFGQSAKREPGPAAGDLLPRRVLFGNPDRAAPAISPYGGKLAWLAPRDGVMNIWVAPVSDIAAAKPVTGDRGRGIRRFVWTFRNDQIVYLQDEGGNEDWRLFAVNVETLETRALTPAKGVAARIQHLSPQFPDEILVALNSRDPKFHDLHRITLESGESTLLVKNERGFTGFVTDDAFQVRFGELATRDGGSEVYRYHAEDGSWTLETQIPMEDALTTEPVGFDESGTVLYLKDSRKRDTAGLFAVNLADGSRTLLAEDARADAGMVLVSPANKTVQAVAFEYDRRRWEILDADFKADFGALGEKLPGDLNIVSRTQDDQVWILAIDEDARPQRYAMYERGEKKVTPLFSSRSELETAKLAAMKPVIIPARDGLSLVSYLTLPKEAAGKRGRQPGPMVLLVHGGPWARDGWGFNPLHQWLADRGYSVLSVNFRGSTGFGKKFINAGNREWASRMHDDLLDAVDWAIAEKIADPAKIAIMGGSYGGYATLVGLTFTPDKFACGVSIVGPSNLVTLLESVPPYWQPMLEMLVTRVGDHRTEEGRKFLTDRSPLSRVDRIVRPLLIGQGANDPRVKQAESDQIVQAMKQRKIPVTYALYSDEGHGFARPENRMSFYAVAEQFLARILGGRSEPIGDDLRGSSLTVPEGAEAIPGLPAALR